MTARRLLLVLALVIAGVTSSANAAPPVCEVGDPNCMPTPEECVSGEYNGVWPGGEADRMAVCLALAGQSLVYAGGDVLTACGTIGIAGTYLVPHTDPNRCPPTGTPPGPGVPGSLFQAAARGNHGAIASQSAAATAVGAAVLHAGGNAVDAAVATTFAIGITRPDLCGIGGRGSLVYRGADGEVAALDYQSRAPAAVTPTTMQGFGIHTAATGRRVLGVPGIVAGMDEVLHRYGTISLAEAIAPAERMARNGIVVSPELAFSYQVAANAGVPGLSIPYGYGMRLRLFPASAAIYLKSGVVPYQRGDTLVQKEYADSLARIAGHGASVFYRGPIRDAILAAMDDPSIYPGNDGLLTARDFEEYRAVWRDPVVSSYRGADVVASPPPASGVTVAEVLNILEGFDIRTAGHSSADHVHFAAEAQKIAFADLETYGADPDVVDVPTEILASQSYADARRAEIDRSTAKSYDAGKIGTPSAPRSEAHGSHTTHVSAVDAAGNAIALTCTAGALFGSAWVAPGAGFLMADVLNHFSEPGTANEPDGGKRPLTTQSPVIVVQNGRPVIVAGGGGDARIPMAVTLAVSNVIDFSFDVARAVDAARIDARRCCTLIIEDDRVPIAVLDELARRGHELARVGEYDGLPWVQVAGWDLTTDEQSAAFDPRNEGAAAAPRGP